MRNKHGIQEKIKLILEIGSEFKGNLLYNNVGGRSDLFPYMDNEENNYIDLLVLQN